MGFCSPRVSSTQTHGCETKLRNGHTEVVLEFLPDFRRQLKPSERVLVRPDFAIDEPQAVLCASNTISIVKSLPNIQALTVCPTGGGIVVQLKSKVADA